MEIFVAFEVPEIVYIDPKRYKQVIFNLIGNAVKFTFEGGITIRVNYQNNILVTECEDTGIGIKEEDKVKLFKSFGKLHDSKDINKNGLGLGLNISQLIC